ncbi:MAG: DNA polymerase IV [Bacteroidota bacterium]
MTILHVDLDAFYASVEQRDDAALQGKPVVVGGSSNRGVVMAASYEARVYGVHSAMPMVQARRLCPDLIVCPSRFEAYREASRLVRGVFKRHTDLVEPTSLDEAYLDVTATAPDLEAGGQLAQQIREEIRAETGLAASAGVSFGKFLAKTASGLAKPDGLRVVTREDAPALIGQLPIDAIHGVGPATARRLRELGIDTGADLRHYPETQLRRQLGKTGSWLARIARCEDDRPVVPNRIRKSVGAERTFRHDLRRVEQLEERLASIAAEVARRLGRHGLAGRTVTLKLKSAAFVISSRSTTLATLVDTEAELLRIGCGLLRQNPPKHPVRLIGLSVSTLAPAGTPRQLSLWQDVA